MIWLYHLVFNFKIPLHILHEDYVHNLAFFREIPIGALRHCATQITLLIAIFNRWRCFFFVKSSYWNCLSIPHFRFSIWALIFPEFGSKHWFLWKKVDFPHESDQTELEIKILLNFFMGKCSSWKTVKNCLLGIREKKIFQYYPTVE